MSSGYRAWLPGELAALTGASLDAVRTQSARALDRTGPRAVDDVVRVAGYEQTLGAFTDADQRLTAALDVAADAETCAALASQLAVGRLLSRQASDVPDMSDRCDDLTTQLRWNFVAGFTALYRDGEAGQCSWAEHMELVERTARGVIELARSGRLAFAMDLAMHAAMLATCSGDGTLGLMVVAHWRQVAIISGAHAWLPYIDSVEGHARTVLGQIGPATAVTDRALAVFRRAPQNPWAVLARGNRIVLEGYQHVSTSLDMALIERARRLDHPMTLAYAALFLATARLTAADLPGALHCLLAAGDKEQVLASLSSPDRARALEIFGLIAAYLHDRVELAVTISRLGALMSSPPRELALSRLRLARADLDGVGTDVVESDAARAADRWGSELEQLRSRHLILLSRVQSGERTALIRSIADIDLLATRSGAPAMLLRAIESLRPESTIRKLTSREAAVAAMVLRGWSNRRIAASLYLAESSVERHVRDVLRATGSVRRAALFLAMLSHDAGVRPPLTSIAAVQQLTPRQRQVAVLVAVGATNAEIADALLISTKAVEKHIRLAGARLRVQSRVEIAGAVLCALHEYSAKPAASA